MSDVDLLDPIDAVGIAPTSVRRRLPTIAWAIYLAVSWTWCIGMFLPVLLVRDYGVAGWIVFAIPNVLGAAAMGWVLQYRQSSQSIVETHATACRWFSIVTLAFHIAFVGCILAPFILPHRTYGPLILAFVVIYFLGKRFRSADLISAAMVFTLSVAMLIVYLVIARGDRSLQIRPHVFEWRSAVLLSPACFFGFALCPYLDLTFHRARSAMPAAEARMAFSVGFGVFFLLMIVFTLIYAEPLARGLRGQLIAAPAALAIGTHLIGQIAFTTAIHTRQRRERTRFVAASFLLALAIVFFAYNVYGFFSIPADELVYRIFMGFYGLIFPAYVWLCLIPGRGRAAPNRRQIVVLAVAVALALPGFWLGFIQGKLVWIPAAVGLVLLARIFVRTRADTVNEVAPPQML